MTRRSFISHIHAVIRSYWLYVLNIFSFILFSLSLLSPPTFMPLPFLMIPSAPNYFISNIESSFCEKLWPSKIKAWLWLSSVKKVSVNSHCLKNKIHTFSVTWKILYDLTFVLLFSLILSLPLYNLTSWSC